MRKIILLLLLIACSLFLFSCSFENNDNNKSLLDFENSLASDIDYSEPEMEKVVSLYYQLNNSDYLGAEKRLISFDQDKSEYNQIMDSLMNGPDTDAYKSFNSSFVFDRLEVMPTVINVYFDSVSEDYLPYETFTLAFAVTNTLCDFAGVDFVNFYLNNQSLLYNEHPVGTLIKTQNSISEEINRIEQMVQNNEYYVTLYYINESSEYILPDVRLVKFNTDNYIEGIINELKLGSDSPSYYLPVPEGLDVIDVKKNIDSDSVIDVSFNKLPYFIDDRKELSLASICYSVLGFVDADKINLIVNNIQLSKLHLSKSEFSQYVGQSIELFAINESNSSLNLEQIIIGQNNNSLLKNVVNTYFDDYLTDTSYSIDDIVNSVYYSGKMIVVDFNKCIYNFVDSFNVDESRLFVYSLVNTLTYLKDVNSVMIIIDGKRCSSFAGLINISEPLLINPGLIK